MVPAHRKKGEWDFDVGNATPLNFLHRRVRECSSGRRILATPHSYKRVLCRSPRGDMLLVPIRCESRRREAFAAYVNGHNLDLQPHGMCSAFLE